MDSAMSPATRRHWLRCISNLSQAHIDARFVELVGKCSDRQFLLFSAAASAALAENDPR